MDKRQIPSGPQRRGSHLGQAQDNSYGSSLADCHPKITAVLLEMNQPANLSPGIIAGRLTIFLFKLLVSRLLCMAIRIQCYANGALESVLAISTLRVDKRSRLDTTKLRNLL